MKTVYRRKRNSLWLCT